MRQHARSAPGRLTVTLTLTIALALALVCAGRAHANGRLPGSSQIAFHPTDNDVIVARVTFGLVVSGDGGRTWGWICEPPLMIRDGEDPAVLVMGDGAILATTTRGVVRGANGGCDWSYPDPALEGFYIVDSTGMAGVPSRAFVVSSAASRPNSPWRSDDNGMSWVPLGTPLDGVFFETIDTAPSDPLRLYMTGAIPPTSTAPRMPAVYSSNNGGTSFDRHPFTLGTGEQNIYLAGVDPANADRIFVRVLSPDGMDRLVVSDDAGQTVHDVLALTEMLGFARSPDGATVWAGGPDDGLWRSTDRGETFVRISDVRVGCLAAREGELWACGNDFRDLFAVGRSTNGGDSFEPMLTFERLDGVLECPAGSPVAAMCPALWPDLQALLGIMPDAGAPALDAGSSAPDAGADAGLEPAAASSDCGCRVSGARAGASWTGPVLALLAATLLGWRTRRPRRGHAVRR